MGDWYARPVLAVRDAPISLGFYCDKLGFRQDWRYAEEGRLRIVQVSRDGCELILSDQWPEDAGQARIFISLDPLDFDRLSTDTAARGLEVTSGFGATT
jgi:catechol 2,3-dioxygenase-like lactoylglutathione lyase family enzyme